MKKCVIPLFFIVLVLSACGRHNNSKTVIGKVYGAEHEYLSIGEDTYTACYDSNYHAADKDEILGCVIFENTEIDPMIVYSLKDMDDNEYVYTLWVYDGCIYKKDKK